MATRTHGETNTHLYKLWQRLKKLQNDNASDVILDPSWYVSYQAFADAARSAGYSDVNRHIHQHNLKLGYYPGNICFKNKRYTQSKTLEYDGIVKTISDWAEFRKINRQTLNKRIDVGWTIAQALEYAPPPVSDHKESKSHLYKLWQQLKENGRPHLKNYEIYAPWLKDYVAFADYAKSMGYSDDYRYLHRHNLEIGYVPGNIYFTNYRPRIERVLLYEGVSKSISDWARLKKIKPNTLSARLKAGWTIGQALGEEARPNKRMLAQQIKIKGGHNNGN